MRRLPRILLYSCDRHPDSGRENIGEKSYRAKIQLEYNEPFFNCKFRENIAPRITGFIRRIANMNGQKLAPSERAKLPQAHHPKSLDQRRKSGNLQKKKSFKP